MINVPRREIGSSTLEKLSLYATQREQSLYTVCDELGLEGHLSARYTERLRRFKQYMDQTRQRCYADDPIAALKELVQDIDYEGWIRQNSSSETLERDEEGKTTFEEAIAKLVLRDMLERQEQEQEGADGVQMMTLHASKGLEFPFVYIMGAEEELLPHKNSIEADTIEEERRLAYVGITRAREQLTFTYASKRKQYGELVECTPSRFLSELPQEDLDWEGLEAPSPETINQQGNNALANMRALLKQ